METPPKPVTLVLADDHGILREGIAAKFAERPEMKILGQAGDGAEALELILALKPDFAIVDLQMPRLTGLDIIRRVRQTKSETRIIVLSITRDENVIRELFRSGANGYLLKDGTTRHLFDAINYIQDGGQYLTPLIRRDVVDNQKEKKDSLTLLSKR